MHIRDRIVELRRIKASTIKPHPLNWRTHPPRQREALKGILGEVGYADALLARQLPDGTLQLIDGHLRAETTPDQEVPVLVLDVTEEEAMKLLVSLDPLAAMARCDRDNLEDLLAEVSTSSDALEGMIQRLAHDAGLERGGPLGDDEASTIPDTVVTQRGDLWILGDHRLLCGDATDPASVRRLMAGQRAVLMATDPPYFVDYDGGNHPQGQPKSAEGKEPRWDGFAGAAAALDFYHKFLALALEEALGGNIALYQWHASRHQALVEEAWKRAGLLVHQQIIWAKKRPVLTYSHFMWQHEPCFYGWVEGKPPLLRPDPCLSTVWEINQEEDQEGVHLTQKPLEIFAIPLRSHTRTGEIVYEPFSGSGSQIIAAERLGRRCYAMELEPKFVDASIARWQRQSQKKAVNDQRPGIVIP